MRRHLPLASIPAFAVGLAAMLCTASCASSARPPQFDSWSQPADLNPINRMLVVARVKSKYLHDATYRGFQIGMTAVLLKCGIDIKLLHPDPMGLNERERLLEIEREFQPSTVLLIKATGGTIGYLHRGTFQLKVFDLTSGKVVWYADAELDFGDSGDPAMTAGAKLAASIIERLREDGVLSSCPAGELFRIACPKVRRQVLADAQKIDRYSQRMKENANAPTCE